MFNSMSKRERVMALTALILIILVGYYFYLYRPLQQEITRLKKEVNIKQKQIQTTTALEEQLPELLKEYEELRQKDQTGTGLVSLEAGNFIKLLYQFVAESGVELQSYLPGSEGNLSNLKLIIFGSYQGMLDFLSRLKVLENNVQYSSLSLQPAGEGGLVMELKLLYKKGRAGGDSS